MIDLDRYFKRIGYGGVPHASLDTLRELHLLHPQAIAFENLNPLLGWPVLLDAASLQRKLVLKRRGGYCFEHNLLFGAALRALGFQVTDLAARVLWNAPPGSMGPRSHMLLRVELQGRSWIADVGFGGLTLTAPLLLQPGLEQATPHEPFRILDIEGAFVMQARVHSHWKPLYRFDLQPQCQSDYEVTNWYLSNHPASRFVTGLMAARAAPGQRYALQDNALSIYTGDGKVLRSRIDSGGALRALLEHTFGLVLDDAPELHGALERLCLPQTATLPLTPGAAGGAG